MGTSTSFRAPPEPRWSAFVAALLSQAPLERIRSELFNAGAQWQLEIAAPAIAVFAEAVARLHSDLPRLLLQTERADTAIGELVAEARNSSMHAGFSAANALAERGFARLVLETAQGIGDEPRSIAARWEASRGSAIELVGKYAGEVLGQFARHAVDREAGRLVSERIGVEASARLSEALALRASSIAIGAAAQVLRSDSDIGASWPDVVSRIFASGRELPRDPQ
jgi:hypothetical protein